LIYIIRGYEILCFSYAYCVISFAKSTVSEFWFQQYFCDEHLASPTAQTKWDVYWENVKDVVNAL